MYGLIPSCKNLMLYGCLVDAPVIKEIGLLLGSKSVIFPGRPIIYCGGPIAKSFTNTKNLKGITCFVDGPGEDLIWDLCHGRTPQGYASHRNLKHNINHYPFPDRKLLNGNYGGNIFRNEKCEFSTTILTSRGCQFRCAFCSSGTDSKFNNYNIGRIEKEIESCLSLGITNIRISDDNLIQSTERLNLLCQLLKKAGMSWRASIRTNPNRFEMYEMMKDAGCKEVSFGVESGDQTVLDILNKNSTTTKNTVAIKNAKRAGLITRALMLMGTPGEKGTTIEKNIKWVERALPDSVSLKMFVPYPGTDIAINPDKYKCKLFPITDANNSAYRPDKSQAQANIQNEYLTKETLTDLFHYMKAYLESRGLENRG